MQKVLFSFFEYAQRQHEEEKTQEQNSNDDEEQSDLRAGRLLLFTGAFYF